MAPATGLYLFAAIGQALQALAYSRLGKHQAASDAMQASDATAARIGGQPLMMFDWIAAARAELALNAGILQMAIEDAEKAAALADAIGGILAKGWAARVWGQALAQKKEAVWDQVDAYMATSLRAFQACEAVNEQRHTHTVWSTLYEIRGDTTNARRHFDLAAQDVT